MKFETMTAILFTLLSKRKETASSLAEKYGVSIRSVYRYIDEMIIAGIPIDVVRGSKGGIFISDAFKLPNAFMTKEEYEKTLEAMLAMNGQISDPVLLSAIEKISSKFKEEKRDLTVSGNILVDSGTWGDTRRFSEKLALFERAVNDCEALDVDYVSREGERSQRRVEPHLLVYKQNVWYIYAYCRKREAFRLFKLGRIRSVLHTGLTFERRAFRREDVPLTFWHDVHNTIDAVFEISAEALPFAEEWLGIENLVRRGEKHYSEATLADDESLIGKILSAGGGLRVLSPASLAERVRSEAQKIADRYREDDRPV